MKKVIIIDDEPLARSITKEYLLKYPDLHVTAECGNGFEGLKAIQNQRPDLILLDIQMPRINGFEMLELIDDPPSVIFATAYDEFAIKAFETNAVDYLLKPFSQERFDKAIEKWISSNEKEAAASRQAITKLTNEGTTHSEEATRIVVRNNSDINIVPVEKIHYIEAYDDYVKIFTAESYFLKKRTMNYYEQVLNPAEFFRTHRSYIINLKELTRIETMEKNSYVVFLRSGKRIPLSRTAYTRLKNQLGI